MNWILRNLLELAGSRPGLRRAARRLIASVPLLARFLAWLMARGNADMIAAAAGSKHPTAHAKAGRGFDDQERLFRTARQIVARHRDLHGMVLTRGGKA